MMKPWMIFTLLGLVLASGFFLHPCEAQQSYSYKCPKCGVIMTYGQPGNYTCPNDGWTLIRQF